MVGGSESMVIALSASMAAWFTPTVLFCVMNIIVGTIFIASKGNDTKHQGFAHRNSFSPIVRVSSFLDRAMSMNLSSYTATITTAAELQHQYRSQSKTAKYSSSSRLAQSIHSSSSHVTPPELTNGDKMSQSESERHPASQHVRAPSLLERIKSIKFLSVYSENTFHTDSEHISNSTNQLVRAPSFLDRVKSFYISPAFKSGVPSTQTENVGTEAGHNPDHNDIKSKSEKTSVKKPLVEMKKSRSEMRIASDDEEDVDVRRPATARARRNVDDEEVDSKADDFISRFKQQLRLQRVESLVRYRDRMNRRT